MNTIWFVIVSFSILFSILTGNTDNLTNSILTSATEAVELIITMTGTICLWSGITKIADQSGLSKIISKILSPLLSRLFPNLNKDSKAFSAISANVTANLLGLGNAATPLGIKAMKELSQENQLHTAADSASRDMVMFVILNTTSIQLMPTMIISILKSGGSSSPTEIIPKIWIASLCGLLTGILAVTICYRNNLKGRG